MAVVVVIVDVVIDVYVLLICCAGILFVIMVGRCSGCGGCADCIEVNFGCDAFDETNFTLLASMVVVVFFYSQGK